MLAAAADRREFIKGAGALVIAFSIEKYPSALAQNGVGAKSISTEQVDGFLAIDRNGDVTLYSEKVDLGTGLRTALAQIVAEELDVAFTAVTVIQGDTALTPDQGLMFMRPYTPGYSDDELAALGNFVIDQFGHRQGDITPEQVRVQRAVATSAHASTSAR